MRNAIALLPLSLVLYVMVGAADVRPEPTAKELRAEDRAKAVSVALDQLHALAAKADGERYFGLYTSDAVFLGTDGAERWNLEQFSAYAKPFFDKGKGWTYLPRDRHVTFSEDGRVAWFDEMLDNAKYGECRGSGVLVLCGAGEGEWKIAQYDLSKTVPNDRMEAVVSAIAADKPSAKSRFQRANRREASTF